MSHIHALVEQRSPQKGHTDYPVKESLAAPLVTNKSTTRFWRALKRADVPSTKETAGLFRGDGKRPDGLTLVPWQVDAVSRETSLLWTLWPALTRQRRQ